MSQTVVRDETAASPPRDHGPLEVTIFQIADDALLLQNRDDGTGWDWGWAGWQRDWMDATPNRFAYRCLPLTIANQTGLWIKNPVGFTATWRGSEKPGSIDFHFDEAAEVWTKWISNEFGAGIITWNTPFLFRTKPAGSRLLVAGPANLFKDNTHPLTAIIESDWMTMSFTMNWKIMRPGEPVRFEAGEPVLQAIPVSSNSCADIEGALVSYKKLDDDPEVSRSYREWDQSRKRFMERSKAGALKADEWQRDYFLGRDASGQQLAPLHMTKLKPPKVGYEGTAVPPRAEEGTSCRTQPSTRTESAQSQVEIHAASRPPVKSDGRAPQAAIASSIFRPIDDEWRRWVAENLLLGASRDSILKTMIAGGLSPSRAAAEIDLAISSPYLRGVERVCNRLKKREWLLAAYRKLSRLHPKAGEIPRRHKLSRDEFLERYYCVNRPVIVTGMMDDWPALRKWSLDYFAETFGDREVDVQFGRDASHKFEEDRETFRRKMTFSSFIEKVRTSGVTNDFYITANNNPANKDVLPELWDDVVQVPEFLDGKSVHNGFFWFGPAGTITPFHHDLTNNLMAQVIGRKRILLAPSWDMPLMRNLRDVYCEVDGRTIPPTLQAGFGDPQILECCLAPAEILFLPVGCLHFVEALDISVTVSFTNFAFDDNDFASFYESRGNV
jgi:Family of unknown function (DUF6065)/Cupin-like domain